MPRPGVIAPYLCFGLAALSAVLFSYSEDAVTKHRLASAFAPLIGLALLFWGLDEIRDGEIRGARRRVRMRQRPLLFWLMVGLRRFVPAVVLIPAGVWLYWFRAPQAVG